MISLENIYKQLPFVLKETNFEEKLGTLYRGKVRDNYTKDGKLTMIATDRLSAFDKVITHIPFKGEVLTQMAKFWFENTKDIIKNHVISYPDKNVLIAKKCTPLPVEMVVRGYLTGVTSTSAWTNYKNGVRNFCGNKLPDGMKKDQKFDHPILTPSTKAIHGDHDESVSPEELLKRTDITKEQYDKIAEISLKLYNRGVEISAKQGIILVDTKYEFGLTEEGEIVLIDEIHTPDSSRFWFANEYEERFKNGEEQKKIDKEYLRTRYTEEGLTGQGKTPELSNDIKAETARRYIEAYELITGQEFKSEVEDVYKRIKRNLNI